MLFNRNEFVHRIARKLLFIYLNYILKRAIVFEVFVEILQHLVLIVEVIIVSELGTQVVTLFDKIPELL